VYSRRSTWHIFKKMLDLGTKKLCDLCFSEVSGETCDKCSGVSNIDRYPTALKEGTVLAGKYAVGKVLGKGGFGITYLCFDISSGNKVAIKEYLPDTLAFRNTGDSTVKILNADNAPKFTEGAKKFYEEAQTVSKFKTNENIIHVNEFFFENKTAYFAMEYLEGVDLKGYIRKNGGKIAPGTAVSIISKAIDALGAVHAEGVLHRDISPDNIFVCNDGRVKLIDFGAARFVVGEASQSLSVILKHGFAPLEQYNRKGNQGPWTDIYALGATFYFALTGKIVDDVMTRMEDDSVDMSGIPGDLMHILTKMLALKSQDRYQSTAELKAVFANLEKSDVPVVIPEPIPEPARPTPKPAPPIPEPAPPIPEPHKDKKASMLVPILIILAAVVIGGVAIAFLLGNSADETTVTPPTSQVVTVDPGTVTITPEATEPDVTEPDVTEPDVTEPDVTEPEEERINAEVESIILSETSRSLTVGGSFKLEVIVNPSNATNYTLTWISSNINAATVDGNGNVFAKGVGTATITVKTSNGKSATCKVTVTKKEVAVTGVSFDKTSLDMYVGETDVLKAIVAPSNATSYTLTWISSNVNAVTVDGSGRVVAKGPGTATITVKTSNGKSAICTVTKKDVAVTGVSLDRTSLNMLPGDKATLKATVNPSNATNKSITWSSSNQNVATVDGSGKVTAKGVGTATITVKTSNGKSADCKVTVTKKDKDIAVTSVSLDYSYLNLEVGENYTLVARVNPSNATSKSVTWSSSNQNVATIDGSGKVTAKGVGTATITVKSSNGKSADCKVTVTKKDKDIAVTSVSLDYSYLNLEVDENYTLVARVNPSNATNKSVTWSSSNTNVATVDGSGKVTAKGVGTATITVNSSNGKSADCKVTVTKKAASVPEPTEEIPDGINEDTCTVVRSVVRKGTPTIDGKLDSKYKNSLTLKLHGPADAYFISGGSCEDTTATGTVYAMYDNNYVYIFFHVVDNTLIQADPEYIEIAAHPHLSDAVEVRIGDDLEDHFAPYDGSNDNHHLFYADAHGLRFSCYEDSMGDDVEKMKCKTVRAADGKTYYVEMAIPIQRPFEVGEIIEFVFQINDLQDDMDSMCAIGSGYGSTNLVQFKIGGDA